MVRHRAVLALAAGCAVGVAVVGVFLEGRRGVDRAERPSGFAPPVEELATAPAPANASTGAFAGSLVTHLEQPIELEVSGVVLDELDLPVPGAAIQLRAHEVCREVARPDAAGRFRARVTVDRTPSLLRPTPSLDERLARGPFPFLDPGEPAGPRRTCEIAVPATAARLELFEGERMVRAAAISPLAQGLTPVDL